MGKNKDQGTAHERATRDELRRLGYYAERLAEGGINDLGDVRAWRRGGYGMRPLVVLSWRRLVKTTGKRRAPDGERDVVIMRKHDFYELIRNQDTWQHIVVECKAAEQVNVTRVLAKARRKAGV